MARWLIQNRWVCVWYDIENWQFGFEVRFGVEGASVRIGLGPFEIIFRKEY